VKFPMADGVLQAHVSEVPVGMYKRAHRHTDGVHIFPVNDQKGYTLLWYEGDAEYQRVDWEHGIVFAPPDNMFHQHFNITNEPVRYFAISFGSFRYPVLTRKAKDFATQGNTEETKSRQIDYENEDPRIRELFVRELSDLGLELNLSLS
jgi:gentisate 1,2-dioxygenase